MTRPAEDTLNAAIHQLLPMVETLLKTHSTLQAENARLQAKVTTMKLEHTELVEKTAQARIRVDTLINRLKILEQ